MKFLFLGGFYPNCFEQRIKTNLKRGYQMAADVFQKSLLEGFIQNNIHMELISFPFISSFPFGYRKIYFKGGQFSYDNYRGHVVSFVNVPFLRYKINNLKKILNNSITGEDDIIIFVYSMQVHLLKPILRLKNKYSKIKICLIVPDLPEFMGCNFIYKKLGLQKQDFKFFDKVIDRIDFFVLLADKMVDRLHINNKPWVRVEGIYANSISDTTEKRLDKTIFYSGAIEEKYGLKTLLDAFSYIKDPNYKLVICGTGSYVGELQNRMHSDHRIIFKGLLSHDKVIQLQKKVTLLINPRNAEGEYTKYSFPSKTMEYLASGSPLLMYRLPAIPKEYFPFFYEIKSNDSKSLALQMTNICEMNEADRNIWGQNASLFIKQNKSPKIQVQNILQMIYNFN